MLFKTAAGFTVIVTVNEAPVQPAVTVVIVYTAVIGEVVVFVSVPLILD